ncbi:MAG: MAPEG family protein [Sphingomonadaceae bacterium]|nr:MAPEG family protein [Sphingomonadaceae bacterium]
MAWTLAALIVALGVYVWAALKVGQARGKYKVAAPATTGSPEFERILRAQQNTVEQMVLFLPLLALACLLWNDMAAGIYGFVWSAGRILYIETYARAAEKRSAGFLLSGGLSMGVLVAILITFLLRHVTG